MSIKESNSGECEDIDYDLEGNEFKVEGLDPQKIYEQIGSICVDTHIIDGLTQYFSQPNTKFVLSLGGGAARGIAGNIAVVTLLQKMNLLPRFEEIWGVSAGSIVAAGTALGIDPSEMIANVVKMRNKHIFEFTLQGLLKNRGLFKTERIHRTIHSIFGDRTFNDCKIPLYILAVEVGNNSEQTRTLADGKITDAIVASSCIPEIFEPYQIDGVTYIDGGMIENVPSISIFEHHIMQEDSRNLSILAINFSESHWDTSTILPTSKLLNLLDVTRYQLLLEQINRVRGCSTSNRIALINLEIPIGASDFSKMGAALIPAYQNLLQKLERFCNACGYNSNI
jgi:predicted acylesterase/phospholipase RssA